jgi:anion-transporting  ArsA/GET3 family ATPase
MLDPHVAILRRLQALSTELIELSGRETSTLSDGEIETLTRRLEEIRAEIARLREVFTETLN